MATKRHRIAPRRISGPVPAWVRAVLERGEWPEVGSAEWDHGPAFWFLGDEIPGLPALDTPEGRRIWSTQRRSARSA